MLELPKDNVKFTEPSDKKDTIVMKKDEVIDILKTLEGLKRKLQPLLKT
jgi:hypothetical protein